MAEVELVIKIPEEEYVFCKKQWDTECLDTLMIAVKYGTPLPKGHGRLIDADALKETFIEPNTYLKSNEKGFWYFTGKEIKNAQTIIEADREEQK